MTKIPGKLSRLEGIVLVLTVLFVVGTIAWSVTQRPEGEVPIVTLTESDREFLPPEQLGAPGMLEGEVLDLNTASEGDLTRLPGIGETKARAIVQWREENGGFVTVEDLLSVDGIGEKTLEDLRPYVTVSSP